MKRELIFNNIASAGSIFWRIVGQLLLPPLLMSVWGTDRYGAWLLITSIATIFSVTDLGFTDAASSTMTMEAAKGNRDRVQQIFQSTLLLTTGTSLSLCLIMANLVFIDNIDLGKIHFGKSDLLVAYIFVIYTALLIFSRFILGTIKAGGYYAFSTIVYDAIQFAEGALMLLAAFLGASFVQCATVYIVVRLINILALLVIQMRVMPWLRFGFRSASTAEIRRLSAPAIAAMAIPLALAMNFQGMAWIAGTMLGPTAAAITGTVRTAARVIIQLTGIFSRAAMPLYSANFANANLRNQHLLERINTYLTIFLLIPGCFAFAYFGKSLISMWTNGKIVCDDIFIVLMAVAAAFHGMWFFRVTLLIAINKHTRFAFLMMLLTLASLAATSPLVSAWGLNGIGVALLGLEFLTLLGLFFIQRSSAAHA